MSGDRHVCLILERGSGGKCDEVCEVVSEM